MQALTARVRCHPLMLRAGFSDLGNISKFHDKSALILNAVFSSTALTTFTREHHERPRQIQLYVVLMLLTRVSHH